MSLEVPLRVALVHDWLVGMRGGEKCLEVFCELFPEADLYTLVYHPGKVSPAIGQMHIRASWINRLPFIKDTYRYYLPLFPRLVEGFELRDYDLVISSSHCVAKGAFAHRALHIAYVYAPMRYVWDMHESYFGPDASLASRAGMTLFRRYLQNWDIRSSRRVDHFVADSKNIAGKIAKLYGREATVIYPPVDTGRFIIRERNNAYYLVVSALVPYKRIDVAVAAFNRLKLPLKIAGDGPLRRSLERSAAANIEFLGWVDDAQLAELYASCRTLIFPGEEDFGIVPLEAQASGRPVIGYAKGGLLETVIPLDPSGAASSQRSGPTGIFFNEQTPDSLIKAVELYQRTERVFDSGNIRRHVAAFSRDRFKAEIREFVAARLDEWRGEGAKNVEKA